jgi:acyl-coenzyme A thioesterase PaaI-like protein
MDAETETKTATEPANAGKDGAPVVRMNPGADIVDLNPATRGEIRRFYTFGTGLNAHPNLLHGGVIACILDSTMGNALILTSSKPGSRESERRADEKSRQGHRSTRNGGGMGNEKLARGEMRGAWNGFSSYFTVQLNTKYSRPVRTPGTVMVRAWIKRIEEGGRKIWVEGVVQGGEKGEVRHASAEGLWLGVRDKKTVEGGRL